ncbi:MAG: DUF4238 domain-containing protein [Bryobacteraceae bacterium]
MTGTTSGTANGEPRRHHYVPRCWLAGFTDTGRSDGTLFVTDLKRRKQRAASPNAVGFIKDFYRLEDAQTTDPVRVEKALSDIEMEIAPILRKMEADRRGPMVEEMQPLLLFIAIQWSRLPAFRPFILGVFDKMSYAQIGAELKTPETWRKALVKAGMDPDAPGADYERMKEFHAAKAYTLTAPTDWYMVRAFESVRSILPGLSKRYWSPLISTSGSFAGSDNPVILEGPKGVAGFSDAELVSYTVSRHVALWGTQRPIRRQLVNRKFVAKLNTLSLLNAGDYVFSTAPDFCWLDHEERVQTDWKLFSKEKY